MSELVVPEESGMDKAATEEKNGTEPESFDSGRPLADGTAVIGGFRSTEVT